MRDFTIDDLKRIMRAAAGEDETLNLDGDILDVAFDELGYDSLALMETASRIERELGIALPEEELAEVTTPAGYLDFVNDRLPARA
ncbi:acyl carrier protein [Actinoallomurus sp. CA-150999]|uniref:acyl carrier protein n=1 Tax=Actinoallomurus sp. CA-150999 TaxID=3239887 RepID=UPI003D932698